MSGLAAVAPFVVVVWLLVVSLYGVVTSRNLIHLAVCVSVLQSSVWVLLLTIGYRSGATAPIFDDVPRRGSGHRVVPRNTVKHLGVIVQRATNPQRTRHRWRSLRAKGIRVAADHRQIL